MFQRRRAFQSNPLAAEHLTTLVRANQLMADSRPLEAAPLFAGVADVMKNSGHLRRAANLYTRAAHAFADGKDAQGTLVNARQALALFTQTGMPARAAMFFANITGKLATKGMSAAVVELQREYSSRITALPTTPRPIMPFRRRLLPTNCPKCGAPVYAEDPTWVDENTLECEYCGAFIRSE